MTASATEIVVRLAAEGDVHDIAQMVDDFVRGHPAEHHPRPLETLRAALFGDHPVARVFVATWRDRVVGMGQWTPIYEMFWAMNGARAEYLYVRPDARGLGISAAIVAAICDDVRRNGGEFLFAGYGDQLAKLYERVVIGSPTRECHLSAEAFQVLADLAGQPPREIVRHLPAPELNRTAARPRP